MREFSSVKIDGNYLIGIDRVWATARGGGGVKLFRSSCSLDIDHYLNV